ncbi:hypothetical protein C8F01DRAFT_1135566 [Mycena amicta]|nr:hypothetical protein C8F01DRAFT_1135566 [Mycena amicta]
MFWNEEHRSPIPPPRDFEARSFLGDDYDSPTAYPQTSHLLQIAETDYVVVAWSNYHAKSASKWHYHFAGRNAPEVPLCIADIHNAGFQPGRWTSEGWSFDAQHLPPNTNVKTLVGTSGLHVGLQATRSSRVYAAETVFPDPPTFYTPQLLHWVQTQCPPPSHLTGKQAKVAKGRQQRVVRRVRKQHENEQFLIEQRRLALARRAKHDAHQANSNSLNTQLECTLQPPVRSRSTDATD